MPALEEAAKNVADEITQPRSEGQEEVQDIQVCILSLITMLFRLLSIWRNILPAFAK